MLLLFLYLLVLCVITNGEYSVSCGSDKGLSFVETGDGVQGRYKLQWCTHTDMSMGQWTVSIRYNTNQNPEHCIKYELKYATWDKHSYFEEDVVVKLNCTNVCFSTNFDLIFNGTCYSFKTQLIERQEDKSTRNSSPFDSVHYVYNNYTKEDFSKSEAVANDYFSGDHVKVDWFLHRVPATNYTMELCTNKSECSLVTNNCTTILPHRTAIVCELWPRAPYQMELVHHAPWCSGQRLFKKLISIKFDSKLDIRPTEPPAISQPASTALWWVFGGSLVLAVGGGAALLICRTYLATKLRERILQDWRGRRQDVRVMSPETGGRRVLLLYARDCAPMMAVAAQLRDLLQHSVDHVYDLYTADVVRQSARAPGEWLRRVIAREDVRVVLLQTPAAACLHAAALAARGAHLILEQPLLNRRVVYRAPHSSDALLPLALRLLTDTAHTTHSYKKFYIATITGLEAELVHNVTPSRRYRLPITTQLLLQDLCDRMLFPNVDLDAQIDRFSDAVQVLHDHVRTNPDYLDEELIFFDYD